LPRRHSDRVFHCRRILAIFAQKSSDTVAIEFYGYLQEVLVMPAVKAIAALASAAAVGCCLFAFSWVGLALLGF
jgi:hypothetical protein